MKYLLIAIAVFLHLGCDDERIEFEAGESELIQNGLLLDSDVTTTSDRDDREAFDVSIFERYENKDVTISLSLSNIPLVKNNDIAFSTNSEGIRNIRLNSLFEMGSAIFYRYEIWEDYPEHSLRITEVSNNKRQVAGDFKLSFIRENTTLPDTTYIEGSFDVKVRS